MRTTRPDARTSSRPWLAPVALAVLGAWAWACEDDGTSSQSGSASDSGEGGDTEDTGGTVTRAAVLDSIAHQVIVPATAEFADQAAGLKSVTQEHADAVVSGADPLVTLASAQETWTQSMLAWQRLEVMQLGPAASSLSAPGGEGLRDLMYSWPTVDTCSIDRGIVDESYAAQDFLVTELVYAYGLDALEYLLFAQGTAHTCPTQVQLDGPWSALGEDEIVRRRAAYAAVVAAAVADQAALLTTRWSPEGDDFAAALARPGQGDSPYTDEVQALDQVFAAMFYADLRMKDAKLGRILGLVEGCAAPPCAELFELRHSGMSAEAIATNLHALREMVWGGPDESADGFDDLLVAGGHEDIAQSLLTDIDAAIVQAESFEAPLGEIVFTDQPRVESLHAAVKQVTDTLKGPFVMALMLTVPSEGAGDND